MCRCVACAIQIESYEIHTSCRNFSTRTSTTQRVISWPSMGAGIAGGKHFRRERENISSVKLKNQVL